MSGGEWSTCGWANVAKREGSVVGRSLLRAYSEQEEGIEKQKRGEKREEEGKNATPGTPFAT